MRQRIPKLILGPSIVIGAMVSCGPPPVATEPDKPPPVVTADFKHCPMDQWGWGAEYEAKLVSVITDRKCNPSDRKDAVKRAGEMRMADAMVPLFDIVNDESEDQAIRIEAIGAIGNFGTRRVLRPFEKLLGDPDPQVSTAAAKALAQLAYMGDRYAIHLMKELAGSQAKSDLKTIAVVALGRSGKFFVADELIVLLGDEQPTIRGDAAEALGILGDLRAVDPLIALLKDEDQTVRTKTCQALGQMGDPKASPALIEVAKDDVERYVRSDAAYALGLIADEAALPDLVQLLKDADENDRWGYQYAVSQYGNLAFEAAVELMASDKKALRQVGVNILSRTRDTRAREHLIKMLDDPNEEVRMNVAYSLNQYGGKAVVDAILARYGKEKTEAVRSALLQAMGVIADPRFEKVLIGASREEATQLRAEAVRGLGSYRSKEAVAAVIEALGNDSEWVREAATYTLMYMRAKDAVKPLLGMLEDDNSWVRSSVIEALGEIGDRSVVPELAKLAKDKDERVRQAVMRAMGSLGGDEAMAVLVAGLNDEKEFVREQAIRSMGLILSDRDVDELDPFFVAFTKGLEDEDYYVRRQAASELANIRVPFPEGVQEGLVGAMTKVDDYALQDIVWALSRVDDKGIADQLLGIVEKGQYGVDMTFEQAVATMDTKLVEQGLVELSVSEDPIARATASLALAYLGSPGVQDVLLGQLESDSAFTRQIAAGGLGICGDAKAAPALEKMLADPDEDVVMEALWSLGQVGRRNTGSVDLDVVMAKLEDENPRVKSDAAAALGYIGDAAAAPRLLELFKQDATKLKSMGCGIRCGVVAQYGFALTMIGDDENTYTSLLELLESKHPRTRSEAARVLGSLASSKGVKELSDAVSAETDLVIRDSLIEALAMTKSPKAVPVLKGLLTDADTYTVAVVIRGLGRTGGPKEAKIIAPYLDHPNLSIHSAAIEALGRLGDKGSLARILEFVGNPAYPWIQQSVFEAIVRIGDVAAAQPVLESVIRDSDRKSIVIMAGLAAAALRIEPLRPVFEQRLARFGLGGKLADIVAYLFGDEDKGNELYEWLVALRIPRNDAMIADFVMVSFQFGGEKGQKYITTLQKEAFAQFVSSSARQIAMSW